MCNGPATVCGEAGDSCASDSQCASDNCDDCGVCDGGCTTGCGCFCGDTGLDCNGACTCLSDGTDCDIYDDACGECGGDGCNGNNNGCSSVTCLGNTYRNNGTCTGCSGCETGCTCTWNDVSCDGSVLASIADNYGTTTGPWGGCSTGEGGCFTGCNEMLADHVNALTSAGVTTAQMLGAFGANNNTACTSKCSNGRIPDCSTAYHSGGATCYSRSWVGDGWPSCGADAWWTDIDLRCYANDGNDCDGYSNVMSSNNCNCFHNGNCPQGEWCEFGIGCQSDGLKTGLCSSAHGHEGDIHREGGIINEQLANGGPHQGRFNTGLPELLTAAGKKIPNHAGIPGMHLKTGGTLWFVSVPAGAIDGQNLQQDIMWVEGVEDSSIDPRNYPGAIIHYGRSYFDEGWDNK